MSECFHIIALQKILKQYQQNKQETIKVFADKIKTVCDHFNHLLAFHDGVNGDEYSAIYNLFKPDCVAEMCLLQNALSYLS